MTFRIKEGLEVNNVDVFNNSGILLVNAPTANKWTTSRNINLTGDVTGTASIDGSEDISITTFIDAQALEHPNTSNLVGSYGTNGIASITVDSLGHITAITTATYLTSESDTLQTVSNRGAITSTAISITNSTASSSSSTGALVVTGGVGIGGSLTVAGNLTVNGTTNTINSTTITVDDINIELGSTASPTDITANGGGITLKGTTDKTFNWLDNTDSWTSSENIALASGKVLRLSGATSGTAIITAPSVAGTPTLTLPTTTGTLALLSDLSNNPNITLTVASTSITTIDTWAIASNRSAKYLIQITQGTNYQISEVLVIHDGTITTMNDYSVLETNGTLGVISSDINSGNVRLRVTMNTATSAFIRIDRTLLAIN